MDYLNTFTHSDFTSGQLLAISVIFIWTGFVRTGIGFGGAALGLPLLLLVDDKPLVFLPIIGTHLTVFYVTNLVKPYQKRQLASRW